MLSPNVLLPHSLSYSALLTQPDERSDDTLELVTDGYLLLDRQYLITYVSAKAELWLCNAPLDLLGECCWRFLPEALVKQLTVSDRDVIDPSVAVETRWLHSSFQTCLKLRLSRCRAGWLLSFHEESAAFLPALQAALGEQVNTQPPARPHYAALAPAQEFPAYLSPDATFNLTCRQEVVAAAENERCRIARELHDVLGQYVTALRFGLDNLSHELEQTATDVDSVMKLQSLVEQFDQEFHHAALKLRPPLPGGGLKAAVVQYALEWSERCGVRIDLHSAEDAWCGLTPEAETTLYRILQEALNNIQKYAGARRVSVILESWQGQLQMVIEDDGCGFEVAAARASADAGRKIGLASMAERAELIGGVCEIESSLGQGTTIFVRAPLRQEEVRV